MTGRELLYALCDMDEALLDKELDVYGGDDRTDHIGIVRLDLTPSFFIDIDTGESGEEIMPCLIVDSADE